MLDQLPNNFKAKSFWEKPEGTTGMLFLAGIIIGGGYALFKILPFLITLVSNTLYLAGLLAILGIIVYVALDPRFRTLIGYMYKSIMRFITGIFITIDPIGILKSYLDDLKKNLSKMSEQVANLAGQMRILKNEIDRNKASIENELKLASKAKETGKTQLVTLKARQAGRLNESNRTLEQLLNKMQALYRVLTKMKEISEILVEDMANEIDVKIREKKAIDASYSAFKSAMSIISGNSAQKELFEQTMEYLTEDYGKKVGEIEEFISTSAGFISSIDMQNMIYEEDALKNLEAWEKKTDSILLPYDQKSQLITLDAQPEHAEKKYF